MRYIGMYSILLLIIGTAIGQCFIASRGNEEQEQAPIGKVILPNPASRNFGTSNAISPGRDQWVTHEIISFAANNARMEVTLRNGNVIYFTSPGYVVLYNDNSATK